LFSTGAGAAPGERSAPSRIQSSERHLRRDVAVADLVDEEARVGIAGLHAQAIELLDRRAVHHVRVGQRGRREVRLELSVVAQARLPRAALADDARVQIVERAGRSGALDRERIVVDRGVGRIGDRVVAARGEHDGESDAPHAITSSTRMPGRAPLSTSVSFITVS
jgi:hypothetical protein